MNDTDVQATNPDYKPKLHKNDKRVLQIGLVNNNVVPGSTKVALWVALCKIRFCCTPHRFQSGLHHITTQFLAPTHIITLFECFLPGQRLFKEGSEPYVDTRIL